MALFAIMVLTFFDVSGRKIWSQSITGSLELTELLMVVVIFGALPLVSLKGEHVVFDSLDVVLPRLVRKIQQGLILSIYPQAYHLPMKTRYAKHGFVIQYVLPNSHLSSSRIEMTFTADTLHWINEQKKTRLEQFVKV